MIQSHAITLRDIPESIEIDIHAERQLTREWCWAACCCGVARWLKLDAVPTEGELANRLTGRTDCTNSPVPSACVIPAPAESIAAIYESMGVARIGPDLPLSIDTLLAELIAGRPVEMGYLWYAGGGHVALVRGFRKWTGRFLVSDPWFGDGELNYLEIAAGYGIGRWALSYGRFARKP